MDALARADAAAARVEPDFETGSLILKGPQGDVALVWSETSAGASCAVPAGEYRLKSSRVERMAEGTHWFLSSTGAPGQPIALAAGKTLRIAAGGAVHFKGTAKRHGAELQLRFSIQGADGRGLSVYRDDRRVPVLFKVLGAKDAVLAIGSMSYG
ncbi:MAG: hypothetical protein ACT4PV_02885 [Planctomycetaceae bacterium]